MSPGRAADRSEQGRPSTLQGFSLHALTPGAGAPGYAQVAPPGLARTAQVVKKIGFATETSLAP